VQEQERQQHTLKNLQVITDIQIYPKQETNKWMYVK